MAACNTGVCLNLRSLDLRSRYPYPVQITYTLGLRSATRIGRERTISEPHYVIYGAGGIGGTIGARMFQSGNRVTLIARGDHGKQLRDEGMQFITPGEHNLLRIPTVLDPSEVNFDANTFVLMCMKSQHSLVALEALAACAPADVRVACVQNGVANERTAIRFFTNTYATVVNVPAVFLKPGEIVTHAEGTGGGLDTGCFPHGSDDAAAQLTSALTDSGFSAIPDPAVMRQKYAKLLLNLGNILHAGLTDPGDVQAITHELRHEALACFEAAGIDCASREEARQRTKDVRSAEVPGYERVAGSSWQSVARGTGDIETEYLNGEICWLGRMHAIATPYNNACVQMARALIARNEGPGLYSAAEFGASIEVK
jgi:2-dehydropantoate 2-reductase